MKAVNVLLALLVSLFIGGALFEGGLRLLGFGPPKVLNEFDSALGWRKQADRSVSRSTAEYDVTFELNSLGLRDDADLTVEKPADTFRVLCLGDSFTLGYTVERQNLFVDQLESWWNAEGRKVQVVNLGTEGYATDQEVAWLEEHGEAWDPDLILVLGYDNDLYYHSQANYLRFPKPRYTAAGKRESLSLEDPGGRGLFGSTAIGNLILPKKKLTTIEYGDGKYLAEFMPLFVEAPEGMGDVIARTEGIFQALSAESARLGAPAVFVPIPSHSAVSDDYAQFFTENVLRGLSENDWDANRPVELFLAAAAKAGVPTLDPRDALRAANGEETPQYFTSDFHLNAAGNHTLATFLHGALQDKLPAATSVEPVSLVAPPAPDKSSLPGWLPWFLGLWGVVGTLFAGYYRKEENPLFGFLKVGGLLAFMFTLVIGGSKLAGALPPPFGQLLPILVILGILAFVAYKLGDRLGTICELIKAFIARGHWYLMPLVVVLLTVGSLLVVAASSPLVAPFIYTLF